MVEVEQNLDFLAKLGVTVTQSTTPADPDIDTFKEFLAVLPTHRVAFFCNYETAGFLYINDYKEFVAASMVSKPRNCEHRKMVVIVKQGNNLALGPDPDLFQAEDLRSTVLVSMNKVDAEALKLVYDPLILTNENCPLPP